MQAGLLCASLAVLGAAACGDAFGPRPRPTGINPDSTDTDSVSVLWYDIQPRAINLGVTDSVRVRTALAGVPEQVRLATASRFVPLSRQPDGTYGGTVAVADLLFNYNTGDLRNHAASIEVTNEVFSEQTGITVNVKDNSVITADVELIDTNVQAASHVVNIRFDSLYLGGRVPPQVLRTFYQYFPDDYDFVNVLEQVHTNTAFHYLAVRNTTAGLGIPIFERSENYGSAARLHGILHFPNDSRFDPAETSVLHELAHRWMNLSTLQSLRNHQPHWPISTLAFGIIGYTDDDDASADETVFRWELTPQANGTYTVRAAADRPRAFNDFELYLMGLLPPDSVSSHIVFLNQNQEGQLRTGGVLSGATDTVTVAKWAARDGVRSPAYPQAPRSFRVATIVLSRGGLLTRDELSFFNAMAIRAESEAALPSIIGTTRFMTLPFYVATGGRGRLITRLRVTPPPI